VGLDLVRIVLASDSEGVADLRDQHGVGADAIDELDQFYELKVYAGAEPDRVSLTDSELQRALTEPGFFLVVVSEVEGRDTSPKVRIIADPLNQLRPADTGNLTLIGIREARSLMFEFEKDDQPNIDEGDDTGADGSETSNRQDDAK
jgi:polyisoprenoid-binding protein YceI